MKKWICILLTVVMIISAIPMASAKDWTMSMFEMAINDDIIQDQEPNSFIKDAQVIKNKQTAYGIFDIEEDNAPIEDYCDMDYYTFSLTEKSYLVVYAESESAGDNLFMTLSKRDDVTIVSSTIVKRANGTMYHAIGCVLEPGTYYITVLNRHDDTKYNKSGYLCYVEFTPYVDYRIKTSRGSLNNFKDVNHYQEGQFSDVAADSWYAQSVRDAYELGLVTGSNGKYDPAGEITIAQTLALACRLHNIYYGGSGELKQGNPWYQVYVDYAIDNEIILAKTYDDYTAKATRSQFAAILAAALPKEALKQINEVRDGAIPDVPMNASHADAIYMLYRAGILTGNDKAGTFGPNTNIQRSAVAAIVTRMAQESARKSVTLK